MFKEDGVSVYVTPPSRAHGIRRFWAHVINYSKCMQENGVRSYAELERLWKAHYGRTEMREVVDELLEAEEDYHSFLEEVESAFRKEEDDDLVATVKVGEPFPSDVELLDVRSDKKLPLDQTYWKESKATLLVPKRHYG